MKQALTLLLLSVILYFVNILVEISWHFAFMEGVTFNVKTEWISLLYIAMLPPVIILYFSMGWLISRLHVANTQLHIFIFACLVLIWRLIFMESIWYREPSLAELVWHCIAEITPSASVLLGFYSRQIALKVQNG